jgi:hypothetical protein
LTPKQYNNKEFSDEGEPKNEDAPDAEERISTFLLK